MRKERSNKNEMGNQQKFKDFIIIRSLFWHVP